MPNCIKIGQTAAKIWRFNGSHLAFVKFDVLPVGAVKRPILHQRIKFRKDRSNRWEIAIFVIFQMAAAAILNFQKFEILMVFSR